jgi:hypothetical protein
MLFTFHWYPGVVPPLTGVAVNVTGNPVQIGLAFGEIVTPTGKTGSTIIEIAFEDAGLFIGQTVFEEVTTH